MCQASGYVPQAGVQVGARRHPGQIPLAHHLQPNGGHANGGHIVARDPTLLQDVFDLLTALFDHVGLGRVGLETNDTKIEVMVLLSGRTRTCLSEDAYLSRMDALYCYWTSKKAGKAECHIYRKKFWKLSLTSYLTTQHEVFHSHLLARADVCQPVGEPRKLWARHLPAEEVWQCPVLDSPLGRGGKGEASQQALHLHFSL